jgi:hypothetical protein
VAKKPGSAEILQIVGHKPLISLIPANETGQISPNPAKDSFGHFEQFQRLRFWISKWIQIFQAVCRDRGRPARSGRRAAIEGLRGARELRKRAVPGSRGVGARQRIRRGKLGDPIQIQLSNSVAQLALRARPAEEDETLLEAQRRTGGRRKGAVAAGSLSRHRHDGRAIS